MMSWYGSADLEPNCEGLDRFGWGALICWLELGTVTSDLLIALAHGGAFEVASAA